MRLQNKKHFLLIKKMKRIATDRRKYNIYPEDIKNS